MVEVAASWLGTYLLYFAVRSLVVVSAAAQLSRLPWFVARRVYRRLAPSGQFRRELRSAALIIAFDAIAFALARTFGLLKLAPPTLANAACTFAVMFVGLEIWFYVSHRALHTRALFFLHAEHHRAKITHPISALSFHLGERALLMAGATLFAIVASRLVPITFEGLLAYFLFNYVLTVVGHLNVELTDRGFARTALGRVCFTATYHAMHHARGTRHFGLFTRFLDRALGTEWEDYEAVHARAASGDGMQGFAERAWP
jgi:sterol desaturase/sphingolipid hydroxylase (fatty acid hydroxylase superfamily)